MAVETIEIRLDETWKVLSAVNTAVVSWQVTSFGDALFYISDTAPAAGSFVGQAIRSMPPTVFGSAKVYVRAVRDSAKVSVQRTVDAGNASAAPILQALTLSASALQTTTPSGTVIGTLQNRLAGSTTTLLSSRRRLALSSDGTSLLAGLQPAAPGKLSVTVREEHPDAGIRDTTLELTVTAPALTLSGTPPAASEGQDYSWQPTTAGGYGTRSYRLAGSLPTGWSVSSTTGAVFAPGAFVRASQSPLSLGTLMVSDETGQASLGLGTISVGAGAGGAGAIAALVGTAGVVSPPSALGYSYTPPFTVTRQANGSFTTNYNIDAQKPAYTNTVYVALDGTNANDGLTYANRVRSLKQAITRANALGGVVRLLVDPGTYKLSSVVSSVEDSFAGLAITCSLVIESATPGQRIISLADVIVPAFVATATDASVYVSTYTTQAVGNMVVDFAALDGKSRPKPFRRIFPAATDEATVVAALNARLAELTAAGNTRFAGASYVDATNKKVYLKRLSGVAPDANVTVLSSASYNLNHVPAAGQTRTIWLCPELECWGSNQPFRSVSNSTGNVTVWAKGGGYGYTQSSHGFSVSGGAGSSFAVGTEVFYCGQDGFNYTGVAGVASINFHEIGTKAYSTGLAGDADGSYNSSTSHKDCRGVRVGCEYQDNPNRTIHDIEGAQTWNLGINVGANRFAGNGQTWDASYASGFLTLTNTSLVFLDACSSPAANSYGMEAYDGGKVFYANMDVSQSRNDVSGTGSSIQGYAA